MQNVREISIDSLTKPKTINYITISKAIGIILVVCGHIGGIYKAIGIPAYTTRPSEIFPLYSFHMPLFIFLSGYFYRHEYTDNIKLLINKRCKSLVIPYYKWNLFYGVFVTILIHLGIFSNGNTINLYNFFIEPIFQGYQYNLNGPSWFLLSLFFVQISYSLLRRIIKDNGIKLDKLLTIILFMIVTFTNMWANIIEMVEHPIPLFISRTLFGVFFFHLGYCFNIYFKDKDKMNVKTLLFIIVLKYNLTLLLGKNYTLSMRTMLLRDMSVVPIIWAILGILYILNLSKILEKMLIKMNRIRISELINFIGNNTFGIMMHHMTINLFVKLTIGSLEPDNIYYMLWNYTEDIIKPILCILFSILFNKYIGDILDKIHSKIMNLINNNKKGIC